MQVGEVIGGSIATLLVQVKRGLGMEWPLPFGSFVKINCESHDVIGVVIDARYESLGRVRPRSRWIEERETFDKIYPDIHEKFLSIAEVFVLGYIKNNIPQQILPSAPPDIHSPAFLMLDDEIRRFHRVDENSRKVRMDYIYRLIDELKFGRCMDVLRVIVDKLESLGADREAIVREISEAYIALGEEETALKIASLLLRRG